MVVVTRAWSLTRAVATRALTVYLFQSTECLARLGLKPVFVSAIGSDPLGVMMLKHCEEVNMVRFTALLQASILFSSRL